MTSLESIGKLRAIVGTSADGSMRYPTIAKFLDEIERGIAELQASWAQEAREHADDSMRLAELAHENAELKREIAEKYMELPVDADGAPIHMGDTLQLGDTRGKVVALTYCPDNGELPWEWQCDTGDWYNTAFARHVEPRTLEDVLQDFAIGVCEEDGFSEEHVRCCAEEIRAMFGEVGE